MFSTISIHALDGRWDPLLVHLYTFITLRLLSQLGEVDRIFVTHFEEL